MKVKVKRRNDPNTQPKKCTFFETCLGSCEPCQTHEYSAACVPMLQDRTYNQRIAIRAMQSVLEEVRDIAKKRGGGCEYCSGTFAEYQHTRNTKLYINTFGSARTIETECMPCPPYSTCCLRGVPARSAFIINYCPNCGRRLSEE